jgi:very-short-patch-repair endonuclease
MRQRVPNQKRAFAKTLRAQATEAETVLWRLLRSRRLAHLKFRRQVPLGPWIVDFVSFERRLIVEVDGSQHVDSDRDRQRDNNLSERGFRILRFWNNDVLSMPHVIADAIFTAARPDPSPGELRSPPSPTRGEGSKRSA